MVFEREEERIIHSALTIAENTLKDAGIFENDFGKLRHQLEVNNCWSEGSVFYPNYDGVGYGVKIFD